MARVPIMSWTRKDFRVDTFRAGGKGGQHQNKTDSAVRITHIDTGLSAESREERSQPLNKKIAFRKLADKMIEHYFPKIRKDRAPVTDTIRTYHEPRGTVKDHRTGRMYRYDDVVKAAKCGAMIEETAQIIAGQMEDE